MGLFNNLFKNGEKRNVNHKNPVNQPPEEESNLSASLIFGSLYQNHISRNLGVVHRCVDLISDSVAQLPIKVVDKKAKHNEDIESHPVHLLFKDMLMSPYIFMKKMIEDVMINGNSYAYIHRAPDGTPIKLTYLQKGEVTVNYQKEKGTLNYKISNRIGIKGIVQPENMIHLIRYTDDGVQGKSVISYASRSIKLAHSSEDSAVNFFEKGCNLAGLIRYSGQLNSKQRAEILNSWNQSYNNGGNGLCAIPISMEYQKLAQTPVDSQLLESRMYNTVDICRFFGVSPVLIGDLSHSQYGTFEVAQQEFVTHTLSPYILMVEQEFSRKLLKDENLAINLDENYLLRIDKSTQATYYNTMLQNGTLCINEVRNDLGLSPIEGGDLHIIPYTDISQNTIGGKNSNKDEE